MSVGSLCIPSMCCAESDSTRWLDGFEILIASIILCMSFSVCSRFKWKLACQTRRVAETFL